MGKYSSHKVLRHKSNAKWYALLLGIPGQKVGATGADRMNILVIKREPEMIFSLSAQKDFAPAYHMNRKHWLTGLLDGTLQDDIVYNLLDLSYELTSK